MVLDQVWMVILPGNKGIIYARPGTNAEEAWDEAIVALQRLTIWRDASKEFFCKQGYRARKVKIVFE